jgi:acetylglutamate synthase
MRRLLIFLSLACLPLVAHASLLSDARLRKDPLILERVTSALLVAAANIRDEDPQTANHAERLAWANSLTTDGDAEAMARRFVVQVAANPTISAAYAAELDHEDVTDNDLQFVVNSLITQYALELFPQEAAPEE